MHDIRRGLLEQGEKNLAKFLFTFVKILRIWFNKSQKGSSSKSEAFFQENF